METTNKDDAGKLRYDVVPASFERALALVLAFGAKKYGKNTWQQVKNGSERYYSALRRHLAAWTEGEFTDKESGLPHLYHVAVNALFCDWFDQQKIKESEPKESVDFDALRNAVSDKEGSCEGCPEDIKKNCKSPYKEDKEEGKKDGVIAVKVKVGNEEVARKVAKVIEETLGGFEEPLGGFEEPQTQKEILFDQMKKEKDLKAITKAIKEGLEKVCDHSISDVDGRRLLDLWRGVLGV